MNRCGSPPRCGRIVTQQRQHLEEGTMGLLDGQKAIVTGGGSGIGRATCRRMAEEGATVAVLDLDGPSAMAVADEIGGMGFATDVGDPDGLRDVVDAAVAALGGLSILYNNAGTSSFSRLHEG